MQPLAAVLPDVCAKFKPALDPASVAALTLNKKPVRLCIHNDTYTHTCAHMCVCTCVFRYTAASGRQVSFVCVMALVPHHVPPPTCLPPHPQVDGGCPFRLANIPSGSTLHLVLKGGWAKSSQGKHQGSQGALYPVASVAGRC